MTPEQELIATLDEYVLLLRTLRVPNIIERSKILREKIYVRNAHPRPNPPRLPSQTRQAIRIR